MGCCISKCVDLFIHECTRQVGCIVPNFDVEFEPKNTSATKTSTNHLFFEGFRFFLFFSGGGGWFSLPEFCEDSFSLK